MRTDRSGRAVRHPHPRRRPEQPVALRISLRHQLGHSVLRMDARHRKRPHRASCGTPRGAISRRRPFMPPVSMTIVPGSGPGLPVGQIPQRIADAEQDFRSPVRMQVAQQRIVVVQIESASALPDQPVGHIDQRRTFALQITRQQTRISPYGRPVRKSARKRA